MANPEHLQILKQGVEVWNAWRGKNPDIIPDLTEVRLSDTRFGVRTPIEQTEQADLRSINLSKALLYRSVLRGADLRGAALRGAYLKEADFRRADLRGADLTRAALNQANLTLANLSEANLAGAMFWETVLARVNLSGALGLESCRHGGPSIIDHRTIRRSGPLPLPFLRGVGLPDELIALMTSLRWHAQFHSCFISYSSQDQDFAEQLHANLQDRGVRCWFAPENLKIGDRFRDRIDESIRLHDKLLLILSESSVSSQWVGDEVEAAFERERGESRTVLFPIRIDDAVIGSDKAWAAVIRRTRHVGDFTHWKDRDFYREAFDRLLRDLKAEA